MAINTSNENLIQQFINEATTLYNYTSSKNMVGNPDYDAKYSVKLGKAVDKIVKAIINSPAEMEEFIKLLESQSYEYLPIHTEADLILNLRKNKQHKEKCHANTDYFG